MESTGLGKHVVNRQIHGKWKKAGARQTSTQRGRGIQQMPAARRVTSRMAGASNTHQQTVTNHSVTTVEVEALDAARKLALQGDIAMPEVKKKDQSCVPDGFRINLMTFARRLKDEGWASTRSHSLTKCLYMLNEIREIKRKSGYNIRTSDNKFLQTKLGPYYTDSLCAALKELRQYVTDGVGWQYVEELDCLAGNFALIKDRSWRKDDCRQEVMKTYQVFFDFELDYLEHMKASPLRYSVEHAVNIIDEMLSDSSSVHQFSFFTSDVIADFRMRKEHLLSVIQTNMSAGSADRTRKKLKESEMMAFSECADKWAMREYYDEIKDRFAGVMTKITGNDVTAGQRVCLVETLVAFCAQYPVSVSGLRILHKELKTLLSDAIKLILLAVAESTGDVDRLKLELLKLISCLDKEGWLDDKTKGLYSRWTQAQSVMEAATEAGKISYAQCKQQLGVMAILLCIQSQSRDRSMMAADMLKELRNGNAHMIDALDEEDELRKDIKEIEENIYNNLFLPIVDAYDKIRGFRISYANVSMIMRSYQTDVIKLQPYAFLVMDDNAKFRWKKIACSIWYCELDRLSQKQLFGMEDINSLLAMKATVPLISIHVRNPLELALTRSFRFLKDYRVENLFIKEAMELSQWVDDLRQEYDGLEAVLMECNREWKAWKKTYDSKMECENVVASSDASVATMEAYACSVTTVADIPPPKAIDHYPRMGQHPVTPHTMLHSTVSSGIPVSVAQTSFHAHELSLMPIQGEGDRQQPGVIIKHEPAAWSRWRKMLEDPVECSKEVIKRPEEAITMYDALSAKMTFVFAENSTLASCLRQYSPIDYGATAMDNSQMVHGQECLLHATGQYLQQRDGGLYDATSDDMRLPANCGSEQFPVFLRGVKSLTNWLLQANGKLVAGMDIDEEAVYATLMKLGSDDGKSAIHELFTRFIERQGSVGNFEIMSNLFVLHKYLLFIHSLLELKSDAWPTRGVSKQDQCSREQTPGIQPRHRFCQEVSD